MSQTAITPITAEDAPSLVKTFEESLQQTVANAKENENANVLEEVADAISRLQNLETDHAPLNDAFLRLFEEKREQLMPHFSRTDLTSSEEKYRAYIFHFFCLMHLLSNIGS